MARVPDALFDDGLAALARLLPPGYSVAKPSMPGNRCWLLVRGRNAKTVTCQVIVRRRVEGRDVPGLARGTERAHATLLVVASYLAPTVRARLLAAGIGSWDLCGSASLDVPTVELRLEREGAPPARTRTTPGVRSLGGEMAGRIVRVLVDLRPPYPARTLAEHARVDRGIVSRMLAALAEAGLVERQGRGGVAGVDWKRLLVRWTEASPGEARGERFCFRAARGEPGFLGRLAQSGLLHALTGASALAALAGGPPPPRALLYVDDVPAAAAQLRLRAAASDADVIMIKPFDRSVFHRSREQRGLRCVSPGLMAADSQDPASLHTTLDWMAEHESVWRVGLG